MEFRLTLRTKYGKFGLVLFTMLLLLSITVMVYFNDLHIQYQIEEYDSKIVKNMVDRNVKINHLMKKGNGEVEIEFDEKEIPFEMRVTCSTGTYEGALKVSGSLEDGEIVIMLLTCDSQTVWEKTFNSKRFATEERFDIYSGEYVFRIGFNDARKGKVKVIFSTLSVIEE